VNFKKAKSIITSIQSNSDGRMNYLYNQTGVNSYDVTMEDCVSGIVRILSFRLKGPKRHGIDVVFTCHDFRINFPLKKNITTFTFGIYNFTLLLEYGIKVDPNEQHPENDLEVEF
jgi:hypothetical protein